MLHEVGAADRATGMALFNVTYMVGLGLGPPLGLWISAATGKRSLALYTSLGFDVTAACIMMEGKPRSEPVAGVEVRPVTADDLEECEALCVRVHGFPRCFKRSICGDVLLPSWMTAPGASATAARD